MNSYSPVSLHTTSMTVLSPAEFLPGLLLALAIGMLIGIERGWRLRDEKPGARVAGIRTFAVIGLLGGLIGFELTGPLHTLSLLLAAGAIAALLLGYRSDMIREGNVSATSAIAAVLTLQLGAMATSGNMALASVGAGATAILLASRESLHRVIRLTSPTDMKVLLRLVLVVFVILPVLPNVGMGPYGSLNPQRLWLVVVVTVAISFVAYVLARWVGQRRGALIIAVVGGLVSSTAVTVNSAKRIREGSASAAEEAAVAVASMMMCARALLLVSILAPFALIEVTKLIGTAVIVSIVTSAMLVYRSRHARDQKRVVPKPPGLGLAFLFAVSVALLAIVSAWAGVRFGGGGGAVVIALGGTADIDAAIAAVGALPPNSLPVHVVALALATPVLLNTCFKLALLLSIAGLKRPASAAFSLAATALAILIPILIRIL